MRAGLAALTQQHGISTEPSFPFSWCSRPGNYKDVATGDFCSECKVSSVSPCRLCVGFVARHSNKHVAGCPRPLGTVAVPLSDPLSVLPHPAVVSLQQNMYMARPGATACQWCPKGYETLDTGNTECSACPVGFFNKATANVNDKRACVEAPAGSFVNTSAAYFFTLW